MLGRRKGLFWFRFVSLGYFSPFSSILFNPGQVEFPHVVSNYAGFQEVKLIYVLSIHVLSVNVLSIHVLSVHVLSVNVHLVHVLSSHVHLIHVLSFHVLPSGV
jgi:hypothetical protein